MIGPYPSVTTVLDVLTDLRGWYAREAAASAVDFHRDWSEWDPATAREWSLLCAAVACRRVRAEGSAYCSRHGRSASEVLAQQSEYEAARVYDPERAAWDDFTDGGLERPGDDEL